MDKTPNFVSEDDPFLVRFKVKAAIWLDLERPIPILSREIWQALSFTRALPEGSLARTGKVRGSLVRLDDADGELLTERLRAQLTNGKVFPIDEQDKCRLTTHNIVRSDKVVSVSVPDDSLPVEEDEGPSPTDSRESIRVQALVAKIGEQMGMSIWIPKADRGAVLREWHCKDGTLLERLVELA